MQPISLALLAYIQARLGHLEQADACLARARAASRDGIPSSLITLILAEAELRVSFLTLPEVNGVLS